MVATINRTNFGGAQFVTCFTCHHARDVPSTTIALDNLYSTPNQERDDIVGNPQHVGMRRPTLRLNAAVLQDEDRAASRAFFSDLL